MKIPKYALHLTGIGNILFHNPYRLSCNLGEWMMMLKKLVPLSCIVAAALGGCMTPSAPPGDVDWDFWFGFLENYWKIMKSELENIGKGYILNPCCAWWGTRLLENGESRSFEKDWKIFETRLDKFQKRVILKLCRVPLGASWLKIE